MATLTSESISRSGLDPTLVAAAAGGDDFVNTGQEFLYIANGSAGEITVTLNIEQTVDGQAATDRTVAIPAAEFRLIGPFPSAAYDDNEDKVSVTYSTEVDLTIGVIKLARE